MTDTPDATPAEAANERDALAIARRMSGCGDPTGPLVVKALIAAIDRLTADAARAAAAQLEADIQLAIERNAAYAVECHGRYRQYPFADLLAAAPDGDSR